jgi:hypothetical protein
MIKNIIWWSYERASWQWDVLCLLIIAFIFLTPKTWFDKTEKLATQESRRSVKNVAIRSVRIESIAQLKSEVE